ncbi:MAG: hypothetical protein A3C47_01035 [Omnitrophica bacterium RIFCSPHIGHO2_02_FULL_51_18]|nr:MAG: hypothetical protein A3C47_01035 [Omnitrophica bacterium RIFCSPHIGHO2_02_FULL_51_18]
MKKRCLPCEGGVKPLQRKQALRLMKWLKDWKMSAKGRAIYKDYRMKDFMSAIRFINRIAKLAEAENHHPDLSLTNYRRLTVTLSTHAIGGLSENDFILAVKIDRITPKQ